MKHHAIALVLAAATAWAQPVTPAPAAAEPGSTGAKVAARGLSGSFDLPPNSPRLKALPHQVADAPLAVRINSNPGGGQRIDYIGAIAGQYDLREYLVHEDGRSTRDLPPMVVKVESRLAADHGEDVLGLAQTSFSLQAYYSWMLLGIGAAWLLVPAVAIGRHLLRAKPQVEQAVAPPPATLAERLALLMKECGDGPMSLAQRAKLELLLLHYWSERMGEAPATPRELVDAMTKVRGDARTAPLVLAVEAWLHGKDADSPRTREQAAAKLKAFREEQLASTSPQGAIS